MLLRRRCSCVKSVVLWISWRGHLKTFSLVNHTKLTSLSEYLASSIFDRLSLAWRLASFSSWPRRLLKHFRPRSWWMIRTMDACTRPVSRAIWRAEWWDCGWSSWLNTNSSTADTFSSVIFFGLPLPRFRSVLPVSFSFFRITFVNRHL